MGTRLREAEIGFRYTPTTTFETFPFPWPPGRSRTAIPVSRPSPRRPRAGGVAGRVAESARCERG